MPKAAPVPFHKVAQDVAGKSVPRLALVMGNSNYPGDDRPLAQPVRDARALAGGSNYADWTGGYAQGQNQITLANVGSSKIARRVEGATAQSKPN